MQLGWMMIVVLVTAITFYTLGVNAGESNGYMRGRAAGMKLGKLIKEQS